MFAMHGKQQYRAVVSLLLCWCLTWVPVHASAAGTAPNTPVQRTILLYMIGSDLESEGGFGSGDLEEIMSAQDSPHVQIAIQTGGAQATGWNEVRRFQVRHQMLQERANLGKRNMGAQSELADFLEWGVTQFPAQEYILVFWSHGSGSVNLVGSGLSVIGPDEIFDDGLSVAEIEGALRRVKERAGKQFEIVGFDACLMGALELTKVLRPYAHYLLASQEVEPGGGWSYGAWLEKLRLKPQLSSQELGRQIIDTFFESHQAESSDEPLTLSLIDLEKVEPVLAATQQWAQASKTLLSRSPNAAAAWALSRARDESENYGRGGRFDYGMVDLRDFVDHGSNRLKAVFPASAQQPDIAAALGELRSAQQAVAKSVQSAVVWQRSSQQRPRASGLSAFVPNSFHILNAENAKIVQQQVQALTVGQPWKDLLTTYARQLKANDQRPQIAEVRQAGTAMFEAQIGGNPDQAQLFFFALTSVTPDGERVILSNAQIDEEEEINASRIRFDLAARGVTMLEGMPVFSQVIDEQDDGYVIGIPAIVNEREGEIWVKFSQLGQTNAYRVIGFLRDDSSPRAKPKALAKGDRLQLLHPVLPKQAQGELEYQPVLPAITLKSAHPAIQTAMPPKGQYQAGFYFFDAEDQLVPGRNLVGYRVP
ncbi:clostripain-related cysteine peptidase [Aquincola tertiaricarbonis]|uniref:Clostripain-related cysteine peptidase n=1 Tax=Aquincola tertiaricarbonis TaxID=391953 RepID=A0ABY4SD00_AQUTE|nr:clostripain-related cysteine peptidase [Aquincola tertiaricarbonis]URI09792.1 clostripain-related cysteine peptidase [Aquincola tertiaricarbonis]